MISATKSQNFIHSPKFAKNKIYSQKNTVNIFNVFSETNSITDSDKSEKKPEKSKIDQNDNKMANQSSEELFINFDDWKLTHEKGELESDYSIESVNYDDSFEDLNIERKECITDESLLTENSFHNRFEKKLQINLKNSGDDSMGGNMKSPTMKKKRKGTQIIFVNFFYNV